MIPPFPEKLSETELVAALQSAKNEKDYIKFWHCFLGLPESDFQYMSIKLSLKRRPKDFLKLMSNPQTIKALDKITDAFGWVAARTTYCGRKSLIQQRENISRQPSLDKFEFAEPLSTKNNKKLGNSVRLTSMLEHEKFDSDPFEFQ